VLAALLGPLFPSLVSEKAWALVGFFPAIFGTLSPIERTILKKAERSDIHKYSIFSFQYSIPANPAQVTYFDSWKTQKTKN
jgi:hypothetical protein